MLRFYHGGHLDRVDGSLWATPDSDYAAAFAQMWEGALWMLTLDVSESEVLDLRGCGLDVAAVATDLSFAGIPAHTAAGDEQHPHLVLRRVQAETIRKAGYRMVRLRECVDWGAGDRHAESVLIVDPSVIVDREVLPLPDRNFQFPDGHDTKPQPRTRLVCPHCNESRGDVIAVQENHITFRCDGCGYHWSS
jgi:hypothetical protein